ncbi:DUF6551 family protein [Streptomyces sp. NPDC017868]|uniref:DUF6551 family protein n=1 Tax=Streptomyces sp. NPDC017868 TaxID=3365014 RepID=UPI0037B9C2E2
MARTSHTSEIELLEPAAVGTDPAVNTRPVDSAWVTRKPKEGFDVGRLGVPTVSARADGTFVWLDGQNRGALCKAALRGEIKINMRVFRGLTLAEEADLFLGLNDNRRVQQIYKFMAEVTAGRPHALEITRIASELGWIIGETGKPNAIQAVAALTGIFRSSDKPGQTLHSVLRIVTNAWGHTPDSVNAFVLHGLASVLNECPDVDELVLTRKLAKHEGGAASLLGKGKGYRSVAGCTVAQGVDQVIRVTYNAGRRGRRLPVWGAPAPRASDQQPVLV